MARIAIFAREIFYPTAAATRATHNVAGAEQSNRDARKTQNSCGFAQYDAIGTQKIAQLIITRHRSHARCKNLLSRDALNIDATNRATWIAGKILSCIDHVSVVRRRPCDGGHRSQSHRRIDVQQSVHRSRARVHAPESHQRIIATRKSIVGSPTPARPPNPRLAGERVGLRRFHPPSTSLCIRHARFCEDAMHRCNTLTGASDVDRNR
jgi:hypothetical protein